MNLQRMKVKTDNWNSVTVQGFNKHLTFHGARLRYDIILWMHKNCGENVRFDHGVWGWQADFREHTVKFVFKHPRDAMMFKLTWL